MKNTHKKKILVNQRSRFDHSSLFLGNECYLCPIARKRWPLFPALKSAVPLFFKSNKSNYRSEAIVVGPLFEVNHYTLQQFK